MLNKLRKQCELLMSNDPEKYQVIKDILANDSAFFEMDVDVSLSILRDLGVEEENLNKVYLKLIEKEDNN